MRCSSPVAANAAYTQEKNKARDWQLRSSFTDVQSSSMSGTRTSAVGSSIFSNERTSKKFARNTFTGTLSRNLPSCAAVSGLWLLCAVAFLVTMSARWRCDSDACVAVGELTSGVWADADLDQMDALQNKVLAGSIIDKMGYKTSDQRIGINRIYGGSSGVYNGGS